MRCIALAILLSAGLARAQFAERWDAPADRPAPRDITVMRGEDLPVEPRFTFGRAPADLSGCTATFWWQTNGMASAWWSSPAAVSASDTGRVSAVWSRTNDVGASSYTWFIGLTRGGTATSYRAYGRLVMRYAPGFSPASAPPPAYYPTLAAEIAPLVAPLVSGSYASQASVAVTAAVLRAEIAASTSGIPAAVSTQIGAATGTLAQTVQQLSSDTMASFLALRFDRVEGPADRYGSVPGPNDYGLLTLNMGTVTVSRVSRMLAGETIVVTTNRLYSMSKELFAVLSGLTQSGVDSLNSLMFADSNGGLEIPSRAIWGSWTLDGDLAITRSVAPSAASAATLGDLAAHTNDAPRHVSAQDRAEWGASATTQQLDAVAADLSAHAASADPHPGRFVRLSGGVATNLTARGWFALPQSQPTNLVLRLVGSNEHIIVEETYP